MSLQKLSQLTREEKANLDSKILKIAQLDISKIRVENIRALIGGSNIEASDICEMLTQKCLFTKHYEYCCPKCDVEIYRCEYNLPTEDRAEIVTCHHCEFENPDDADYCLTKCSREKFYKYIG